MGQWVYHVSAEVNSASKYPLLLAVCILLTTLMVVVVGLRILTRVLVVKSTAPDDWVIVASMVCSVIYNALAITQSRYGLGLPVDSRPAASLDEYTTVNFAGRPFYMAGITGFKVALCIAYLRLTSRTVNNTVFTYRNTIWAVMMFAVATHFGGVLVLLFKCQPIKKSWRPSIPGHCLPNDTTFYVLASLTIVCDVIIFSLPIPLLARLQINARKKGGLISIFMLGLFTTVCSVMRMLQIRQIAKHGNSTMLILWGTIEMNVGITLTCLPALTPLLSCFGGKTLVATERYLGYEKSGEGADLRTSVTKNKIHMSVLPPRFVHPSKGFHTTTITANDPEPEFNDSKNGSKRTVFGTESRKNSDLVDGRPRSTVLGVGCITQTTEVCVHREDMNEEELKLCRRR